MYTYTKSITEITIVKTDSRSTVVNNYLKIYLRNLMKQNRLIRNIA